MSMRPLKRLGVVCAAVALTACTRADDGERTTHDRAAIARPVQAPGPLEQRLVALATCDLEGHQIDASCPALEALQLELARRGSTELSPTMARRLLAHRAPAVRVATAGLVGATPASRHAVVDAGRAEGSPAVRQAFVRELARGGVTAGPVAAFLIEASRDHDTGVRLAALDALTSPSSRTLVDAAAAVTAMVQHDPDPAVQRAACAAGGKLGVDALLPMYEQLTADPDDARYAACMDGLVAMFHDHAEFATSNERAFRLYLTRIAQTPRTEQAPPWRVLSTFCYSSDEADLARLDAWHARSPWFDPAEVKQVLAEVIADPAAGWMARSAAVESLVGLGASRLELTTVRRTLRQATPVDPRVVDKLDRALPQSREVAVH